MSIKQGSVFISHASTDPHWAEAFAKSLEHHGQQVWSLPDEIGPRMRARIERGLRESNLIVLLVTPELIGRANFFFEIGAALAMGKPMVLVLSEDVKPSDLPSALQKRKFLFKRSPEATAEELLEGIAA